MSRAIRSVQRHLSATHRMPDGACRRLAADAATDMALHQRCVGCESSSGCAVERGLEGGEKSGQGQPCFEGGKARLRQAVVRPRRAGDGWPDGNRVDAQRLAIMVSSVDRSPSSSRTSRVVTPGRSGAAAQWSGKASRRSSPSATALTPGTRMGCAVHRGEEEVPHDDAGRTRRCTIAVAVIIVASVGVQSMRTPEQRSATAT